MNFIGNWRLSAVVIGFLAGAMSVPASAQVVNYPEGGPRLVDYSELPDWNGLWERGGDIIWNDAIPPGVKQHAPFNEEYMRTVFQPAGGGFRSLPGMMIALRPLEFHINPYAVFITNEMGLVRRIYTDGRDHPEHPLPSPMGHSIGHWEGNVLKVHTCCLMEGQDLPGGGKQSPTMEVEERFWSPEPGTLKVEISVTDPVLFTEPWTTEKTYYHRPEWEVVTLQGDGGAGRDFPEAQPGENWVTEASAPTPVSKLTEGAFDDVEISGPVLADEDLNVVTARAVGNTAPETVEILDVVRHDKFITWKGKTRSAVWDCAAALDGSGAFCGGGAQH